MSKRRPDEAVLRGGRPADEAARARAINAEPWEPLPGMVKQQCSWCRYLFAAPQDAKEKRCPDCVGLGSRPYRDADYVA